MAAKIFEEWWGEKYSGKLGQTIIEKAFKEVAEEAWKAATIEKFTSTNTASMPCLCETCDNKPSIGQCNWGNLIDKRTVLKCSGFTKAQHT